ncbi:MAG: hypothetical protein ACR5LD_02535 [Symbiopectobacterium sp.]
MLQAHAFPEAETAGESSAHTLVILDTLNALLTLPETHLAYTPYRAAPWFLSLLLHRIGLWLS